MKKLSKLFDIRYGHSLELNRLTQTTIEAGFPFVSRKMGDNGISAYIEELPGLSPNPAGELTCALSGNGVLSTFIQDKPYYTGYHIACLSPLQDFTEMELLYYCACIRANAYRYSWGRQANRSLKDIIVPSLSDLPKWVVESDPDIFTGWNLPVTTDNVTDLENFRWKLFKLDRLFDLKKGRRLTKAHMQEGATVFIGATDKNNGITSMVGQQALHPGNTITVSYNGSVAEAFYQPIPYWCSDDVNVLYPKFILTPALATFICAIIRQEKYRFNYGRKWNLERMRESEIHLPADATGQPDWDLMTAYIQSLPFSSQL
jgi:hypothetical protein